MTTVTVLLSASQPSALLYDNVTFIVSLFVTSFFIEAVNPDEVSVCVVSSVVHVIVPVPSSSVVAVNVISVPLQTSVSEAINVLIIVLSATGGDRSGSQSLSFTKMIVDFINWIAPN